MRKINVGIIGGAGYGGSELIKLLLFHPKVNLVFVTSRRHGGRRVSEVNRFLTESTDLRFVEPDISAFPGDTDLVFFATPHGVSMTMVPALLKALPDVRIIDLSGDFRLRDPHMWSRFYKKEHAAPDLLGTFAYGLSELNREAVGGARYIANPGCFATSVLFAIYPLFSMHAVIRDVSIISVTGSSGSGELPKDVTHHPVRAVNFKSYKILEHQHLPEIKQFLNDSFASGDYELGMVPQSGPFVRGIYTTAVLYNDALSGDGLERGLHELYARERFIRIVEGSPEIAHVRGTNYVEVSCCCRGGFAVSMSAIDNLVRGASGQAVQNMNIMYGFDEAEGLGFPGMRP